MGAHPAIRPAAFIRYKFLNSLFLGLSIGAVFVLYTPLSPACSRQAASDLALGTRSLPPSTDAFWRPDWFFRLSLGVELVTLSGVVAVLLFPLELALALFIYIGYQITFSLGNYLVRCETLLMVSVEQLRKLDVAKQAGYLLGMGGAWAVYTGLEHFAAIEERVEQVVSCWVLAVVKSRWSPFGGPSIGTAGIGALIRDGQTPPSTNPTNHRCSS